MPGRSALRHRGGGTPEQNITGAGAGNGAGAAAEHRGSDAAELDKIFNEFVRTLFFVNSRSQDESNHASARALSQSTGQCMLTFTLMTSDNEGISEAA